MARIEAQSGRFIHIDFPAEGIDDALDRLFLLHIANANNLRVVTNFRVKVSYTGKYEPIQQDETSQVQGLRLVK